MSFTPVTLLVGIVLILGALALFFLDKIRPGYARDTDKVYAVLLLISGFLSLGHLTAGVTESFQLMLMAGMLFTLVLESVRNREPIIEPTGRVDNRPPRPRYNERPPNRRVYRAELDDRNDPRRGGPAFQGETRGYPPRMAPSQDPRMGPMRDDYRRNEYDVAARPRQPYEEYRGPAGRLQPSAPSPNGPNGNGPNRNVNFDNRYPEGNGRYGERPPARPPMQQPPDMNGERFEVRGETRGETRGPEREPDRGPRQNPQAEDARDRQNRGDRALNLRPYSEAPRQGNPLENPGDEAGYRSGQPEGNPSEA